MYPANQGVPTPLSSLDELMESGSADKPMKVFIGHNLGYRCFSTYIPMHEFFEMSEVANDPVRDGDEMTQRKLDPAHASKLALYILKGLVTSAINRRGIDGAEVPKEFYEIQATLGKQPYMSMQPIVCNLRESSPGGQSLRGMRMATSENETASFKVFLSQKHILWVVDGQHRRKGMELVFDFLDGIRTKHIYPKKGSLYPTDKVEVTAMELQLWEECFVVARSFCTISVEIHLGLGIDQERQLFHDLNRLGKKVETTLAMQFDSSNSVNLFIKEKLIDGLGFKIQEKDQSDWHKDTGAITRKDLVAINATLFLNKTNIASAKPTDVAPKIDIALNFWEAIHAIPGLGDEQSRMKTVAAQPVVLKALAKLVYDLAFSNRKPEDSEELLSVLLDGITEIDYSHQNPMWRYFEMSDAERVSSNVSDLARYLPEEDTAVNRDIGKYQGGFMRFGSKHNDIYPIIADMIRWKLNLPTRHKKKA